MTVVAKGGMLFCSTNQRTLQPEEFEVAIREAARTAGRVIVKIDYETLPFDYRLAEGERAYLKTLWVELD